MVFLNLNRSWEYIYLKKKPNISKIKNAKSFPPCVLEITKVYVRNAYYFLLYNNCHDKKSVKFYRIFNFNFQK